MIQKHLKGRKVDLEAEMGFLVSEAYSLPMKVKSLMRSVMTSCCGSKYPLNMSLVNIPSRRPIIDKTFSVPKCVRLARMSFTLNDFLGRST